MHKKLDAPALKKMAPDWVVVAVGGKPQGMEGPGFHDPKVISAWDVLSGKKEAGKRVVIIGGGQVGLETAHFLLQEEKEITSVLPVISNTSGSSVTISSKAWTNPCQNSLKLPPKNSPGGSSVTSTP
jgi:hypothetical protein